MIVSKAIPLMYSPPFQILVSLLYMKIADYHVDYASHKHSSLLVSCGSDEEKKFLT
jgi:hypothetical protein